MFPQATTDKKRHRYLLKVCRTIAGILFQLLHFTGVRTYDEFSAVDIYRQLSNVAIVTPHVFNAFDNAQKHPTGRYLVAKSTKPTQYHHMILLNSEWLPTQDSVFKNYYITFLQINFGIALVLNVDLYEVATPLTYYVSVALISWDGCYEIYQIAIIHDRISIWVCCYAPDFRTGTFIAAIGRCSEIFSRWECGFHWKLCCRWLEGLRRRRVAVIMQGHRIRAHPFIYIQYHMRCYRQNIDLYLYFC